ncbi:serine hydrolase domain-containing protein [Nonomuraea aurantiaca]|uniref:serine hydrolase domain-containing protein n=1 Tax=Nonomuraea aurantiaca TaxID=2878562 RepID=UPI001CD96D53|nr:serine hydrolase domain-containing protein [Nonomuraea aurantiaca]MCA2229697.1 beta-lactamase family protein [Nonomuraea aurantiaca]
MNHATVVRTITAATLLLATTSPATAASTRSAATGDVQQAMDALAKTPGVVGAIGGAYADGKPAGQGSAGSRLLDGKGGTIPANSRFRIGSQSKQMVATVLLQLVEEGRLGLDDKLGDLLPEVAADGLVELADEITVRQLIQHTSGIPDWFHKGSSTTPAFDVFDFTTYYRPIDIVKMTRGWPRTGAPGEKFAYSNTNYTLIGMIIEKVSGHTLADELNRRLFRPLGMTRTYQLTKPPQGIKGPHGHGYYPDSTGRLRDVHRFNASYGNGAGGVVSTTHDVSAFQRAFTQGRLLPPSLQQILTPPPAGGGGQQGPGLCGGKLKGDMPGGSAPGLTALTFASADGRRQFAISVTVSTADTRSVIPAMIKAVEAVLCPVN